MIKNAYKIYRPKVIRPGKVSCKFRLNVSHSRICSAGRRGPVPGWTLLRWLVSYVGLSTVSQACAVSAISMDDENMNTLNRVKKLVEDGNFDLAETLLENALTKSRRKQSDWSNVFLLLLGKISLKQGRYEKSEKYYEELVQNLNGVFEVTPTVQRLTLWTLIDLAQLYSETNKYDKAEILYKQSMSKLESIFVDSRDFHWVVETLQLVLDGYAKLLVDTGRLDEALAEREHALQLYRTLYGDKHKKIVYNLNEIGRIYTYKGELNKAIMSFSQAIDISKSLEMDQMEVAALYVNNGRLHMMKGMMQEAKSYCTEALNMANKLKNGVGQKHAKMCLEEIASFNVTQ